MSTHQPLCILLVDDEEVIHKTIGGHLKRLGHRVDEARDGAAGLAAIRGQDYDLALVDVLMPKLDGLALLSRLQEVQPETSIVMITGHGNMEMAVQALRLGAVDFLTKPIKLLDLEAVLEKAVQVRGLRQDRRYLRETIGGMQASENLRKQNRRLIGESAATQQVHQQIHQAVEAGCDTVLITGETGVGKEVVAREIHFQAAAEDCPFIAVSCPALPESLIEAELFGHARGAFTGAAADRRGYFELADGGTLFLDEVGDLSSAAQASLLRVLETRTLRRVGGSEEIAVNIRIIAATNVSLEDAVEAGDFRQDLLYRLNMFTIEYPPLRDRPEDILPIAEYFLLLYAGSRHLSVAGFSPEAEALLTTYDFPGNARELRNLVERAAILCRAGPILPEHLNLPVRSKGEKQPTLPVERDQVSGISADSERARILAALEATKWNRRQTARNMGITYSKLRYQMMKLGIG